MKTPTIARLFEVLFEPAVRSESNMARSLDLDVGTLRARLIELKSRGILRGPFEEGGAAVWGTWFPTPQAATEALSRSGLAATSPVEFKPSLWSRIWASR